MRLKFFLSGPFDCTKLQFFLSQPKFYSFFQNHFFQAFLVSKTHLYISEKKTFIKSLCPLTAGGGFFLTHSIVVNEEKCVLEI